MVTPTRLFLPVIAFITAAVLVACGGNDVDVNADATTVANETPQTRFELTAKDNKFDKKILVAKADSEIKFTINNEDNGILHNIAIYTNSGAKENLWRGQVFEGKKAVDESFKGLPVGNYYFRCDVHPDSMKGSFIVK